MRRKALVKVLDKSEGKLVRTLDVFLQSGRSPDKNSVLTGIQNHAISSSADFAISHMTAASIFTTKQELLDYAYKMSPLGRMNHLADSRERVDRA